MSSEERADGTAERLVIERPPPGASRGPVPAPRAAVIALGAAIVAAGLVYLFLGVYRRRSP